MMRPPRKGRVKSTHMGRIKMRTIGLLCGVIAAIALAGCQTLGASRDFMVPPTAYKCTYEADCAITVFVTDTNPCVVSVDRSDIEMKGSFTWTGLTHLIRWELDEDAVTAKFRFDPDIGVVLKNTDPDNQFSGQGPHGKKMQYHWRDKNTNTYEYKYVIKIIQKGSTNKCALDPKIFNN